MTTSTDQIEKSIELQAPLTRVWGALTDSAKFGAWFGAQIDGAFTPNTTVQAKMAASSCGSMAFEMHIERIEPQHLFSYRWHPFAVDPKVDYSQETPTLVEFRLEEIESGTRLHIVESGFDKLPADRRNEAFKMNEGGWTHQAKAIETYVTKS